MLLLVFHALREFIQSKPGEIVIQRLQTIVSQCCAQGLPGQRVIALNGILGYVFYFARLSILNRKLDRWLGISKNSLQVRGNNSNNQGNSASEDQDSRQLHYLPPTCSSLPSTTPAATVMVALSEAGNSARAMSFLMRASTVLLPVLSVWINVTIVPSGTGLPLQSRMGSVSTVIMLPVCPATCMRKLRSQGSAAACCTTRSTEVSPAEATNCADPALAAELLSVQATPERLVTVLAAPVPPTESLKFTGVGVITMFWY